MLAPDTYVQPRAADPQLDSAIVLRIVREHLPGAKAVTAVDETGGEARAYIVDDVVVLKTQRPQQLRQRTSLEKETFFLSALAGVPGVSVPRLLGYGRDGYVEYICMSRMPGVAARTLTIEGGARTELLHDLGRMLRRIHALPQRPFYDHPLFPGPRTAEEFEGRLRAGFDRAVGLLQRNPDVWGLAETPRVLADRVLATPRMQVDLVAVHSNPGPEHVFVDPTTLRLIGLIDFGDAYVTHPGFDMRWPRPDDRDALLAGYSQEQPLSDAFLTTLRASLVLADMTAVASRPDRRDDATATLERLAAVL